MWGLVTGVGVGVGVGLSVCVGVGNVLVLVTVVVWCDESRVGGGLRCLYLPSDKLLMRHGFIALGTRFVAA